jgi:hypothetical protein
LCIAIRWIFGLTSWSEKNIVCLFSGRAFWIRLIGGWQKAHVEHPVGLVKYQSALSPREVNHALIHIKRSGVRGVADDNVRSRRGGGAGPGSAGYRAATTNDSCAGNIP